MNPMDEKLNRLFKAAANAPGPGPAEAPFGLATRVVAGWRAGHSDPADFLVLWFRRAALCACMLTLLGLVWSYRDSSAQGIGEKVADAAMSAGVEQ